MSIYRPTAPDDTIYSILVLVVCNGFVKRVSRQLPHCSADPICDNTMTRCGIPPKAWSGPPPRARRRAGAAPEPRPRQSASPCRARRQAAGGCDRPDVSGVGHRPLLPGRTHPLTVPGAHWLGQQIAFEVSGRSGWSTLVGTAVWT
jgi:hypothetical protein